MGATTQIWKNMVYNKDITNQEINNAYGVWAEQYDQDFALVHPNRAQHMADYLSEMLEVSRKKGVYGKLVESAFNTTIPEGLKARSYDCVIMCGGFAAGHVPLASLHTMARLCKKGGFLINSMTK